jgi:hypothetical protein
VRRDRIFTVWLWFSIPVGVYVANLSVLYANNNHLAAAIAGGGTAWLFAFCGAWLTRAAIAALRLAASGRN